MIILGISCFYHDSSACIIKDGEIIVAVQEERFSRIKNDETLPIKSIEYCLGFENIKMDNVDHIVFYDKPFLKFERILETHIAMSPLGLKSFLKSVPLWLKDKLFQKNTIIDKLSLLSPGVDISKKLLFCEHHLSHAASAFYPSPFKKAVILTMDGVGEWATTTVSIGDMNTIEIKKEIHFPHSLGLLYSAFTYHCGFKVNSGEYKLMGLASYGSPKYVDIIKDKLIHIKEDGSYRLDIKYFEYCTGLKMTNSHFSKLFGASARVPETEVSQVYMDLAASIQKVTEEIVIKLINSIVDEYQITNICLAGGVALNSVINGKILKETKAKDFWIQPAAGDAGGSIGAALYTNYDYLKNKRVILPTDSMKGSQLGPSYSNSDIELCLDSVDSVYTKYELKEDLIDKTTQLILDQKCVAWFQGKLEFGPRALGNRSILADPRSPDIQLKLNQAIKKREVFRPFAPAVIEEKVSEWFETDRPSPYMLTVSNVNHDKGKLIPAVTHVDNSARVQTISSSTNSLFYKLLKSFEESTGVPMLVNTSFNVRGEPIVCSPKDAYNCFINTGLDALVIGDFILLKEQQNNNNLNTKIKLDE